MLPKFEMSGLIGLNQESNLRRAAGTWCYATEVVQSPIALFIGILSLAIDPETSSREMLESVW
jgi:hypothetical protein